MKWNEAIFSALTGVRDDLVEKSNAPAYPRSRRWRWAPVAACCALVLGTAAAYYLMFALVAWLFIMAVYYTVKLM